MPVAGRWMTEGVVWGVRADALLEVGDLDGYGVWKGALKAVEELLRAVPEDGEQVN